MIYKEILTIFTRMCLSKYKKLFDPSAGSTTNDDASDLNFSLADIVAQGKDLIPVHRQIRIEGGSIIRRKVTLQNHTFSSVFRERSRQFLNFAKLANAFYSGCSIEHDTDGPSGTSVE